MKGGSISDDALRLTWDQVAGWRLRRHHLHPRATRQGMLDVVADIAGLHAQVLSSAELTLWARTEGLRRDDVRRALWEERRLLKTWAMRGTLHLLPSAEYPLWQAALGTFGHYLKPSWLRAFGVSREDLDRLVAAMDVALDGRMLTREELAIEVARVTGSEDLGDKLRGSWGVLLKPAAFQGRLCFAPNLGQKVRFTRPDQWLDHGSMDAPASEQALREVARRFLSANGPATREDLARWWGTTTTKAAAMLDRLGEEAVEVAVDGTRAWMLAAHLVEAREAEPPGVVRLLPGFDQYTIGATRHAEALLPGPLKERVYRAQGWISPVLLVDGRMRGVWRHERKGRTLLVELEPFAPLPAWASRGAEEEAERLAEFLGGSLVLRWAGSERDEP